MKDDLLQKKANKNQIERDNREDMPQNDQKWGVSQKIGTDQP